MSVSEMTTDAPVENNEVMESLGNPEVAAETPNEAGTSQGTSNNTVSAEDPLYVQKRLKRQAREHEREMRTMQAQLSALQSQVQNPAPQNNQQSFGNQGMADDPIQRAVNLALSQRDLQENQRKQAESAAHVQKQYTEMSRHLDSMNDKYDDFHDEVLSNDKPFTSSMRDYALTLPKKGNGSAGEVLYHLAKNPEELKRISLLHPLDQAAEMAKLSHALVSGGDSKTSQSRPNTLGNIKSMPVSNSNAVTDKTPVSVIRARMKAGTWK